MLRLLVPFYSLARLVACLVLTVQFDRDSGRSACHAMSALISKPCGRKLRRKAATVSCSLVACARRACKRRRSRLYLEFVFIRLFWRLAHSARVEVGKRDKAVRIGLSGRILGPDQHIGLELPLPARESPLSCGTFASHANPRPVVTALQFRYSR